MWGCSPSAAQGCCGMNAHLGHQGGGSRQTGAAEEELSMVNPCARSLFVFLKCHPSFLSPRVISHFSSLPPHPFVLPTLHNIPSCLGLPLLLSVGANAAGKGSGPTPCSLVTPSYSKSSSRVNSWVLGADKAIPCGH